MFREIYEYNNLELITYFLAIGILGYVCILLYSDPNHISITNLLLICVIMIRLTRVHIEVGKRKLMN